MANDLCTEKITDITGTPLMPGDRERCKGNGEHDGFPLCCDECDYFLDCYPEYITDRMVGYTITLDDVDAALQAIKERMKKTRTYTFDEVIEELGFTHDELDAIPDAALELDE